ncbi:MAG: hypothetical protein QXS85_03780 [Acidilobaceae archaeon]
MEAFDSKALAVKVSSLNDLARFASSMTPAMIVMPVYRFKKGGRVYYFLQTVYKDFYKYYGVPVIYYYSSDDDGLDADKARFLLFKVDEEGEKLEISSRTKPGWITVPIVNLEEKPGFIPDELL